MRHLFISIMFVYLLSGCETYRGFSDALSKSADENYRNMTTQAVSRLNNVSIGKITPDQVKIRSSKLEQGVNKWVAEIPRDNMNVRPWLWNCSVPNNPNSYNAQNTICNPAACYPNCD